MINCICAIFVLPGTPRLSPSHPPLLLSLSLLPCLVFATDNNTHDPRTLHTWCLLAADVAAVRYTTINNAADKRHSVDNKRLSSQISNTNIYIYIYNYIASMHDRSCGICTRKITTFNIIYTIYSCSVWSTLRSVLRSATFVAKHYAYLSPNMIDGTVYCRRCQLTC